MIHKKGDREDARNYRPICGLPILYKAICDGTVRSTRARVAQSAATRPGGFPTQPQMRGSPDGVQDTGATVSRVEYTSVHQYNRFHESIRQHQTFGNMEIAETLRSQTSICEATATALQPTRRNSIDWKRKVTCFQSKEERNKGIRCPPFYSTLCCNTHYGMIWTDGRRGEKASS